LGVEEEQVDRVQASNRHRSKLAHGMRQGLHQVGGRHLPPLTRWAIIHEVIGHGHRAWHVYVAIAHMSKSSLSNRARSRASSCSPELNCSAASIEAAPIEAVPRAERAKVVFCSPSGTGGAMAPPKGSGGGLGGAPCAGMGAKGVGGSGGARAGPGERCTCACAEAA